MPLKVFGGSLLLPLRIDGYTFDRLSYVKSIDERISTQLKDQLPDFIVSDYETFVQFIEAYYEWMEQEENPRYEGVSVGDYKDIDETLDKFIEYFRNVYIKDFPFDLADGINEKTLIKHVTDLYKAKGTKASFDLLFRILYNTTVSVSYPRDRILRLSTSTFDDNQFLRIEPIFSIDESFDTINGLVVQRSPFTNTINATAKVDDIEYFQEGGIDFFRISVVDVSGSFNDQSNVELTTSGITSAAYSAKVFPTLSALNIEDGGSGYEINDQVIVRDTNQRLVLTAKVKQIGPNGSIRSLSYENNYGIYREADELVYTFVSFAGTGADFTPKAGEVLARKPDFYKDESGKLSSRSFIQDNFYYQDFSYILRVDQALQKYASTVKKLVHPSGFVMLGEYLNETNTSLGSTLSDKRDLRFNPQIGHYLPHTFGTTIDPRGFTYGGTHYDFYPLGYNGQDGRTAGDFIPTSLISSITGTPHLYPQFGQTHDPYQIYSATAGTMLDFDLIEGSRTLVNGAIGSTGYLGATVDKDENNVGLYGFFPIGSDRTNTIIYTGVTHYGGYVSPKYTSLSGGYYGGQVVQVEGTDSLTADYWIVNRHPAHLGVTGIGLTGERLRVRIPVRPTNLGGPVEYTIGEIVRQDVPGSPIAIGEVIDFEPSSYTDNGGKNTPVWNVGNDILTVDVLNGVFVSGTIDYLVYPTDNYRLGPGDLGTFLLDPRDTAEAGSYVNKFLTILDVPPAAGGLGIGQTARIVNHERLDEFDIIRIQLSLADVATCWDYGVITGSQYIIWSSDELCGSCNVNEGDICDPCCVAYPDDARTGIAYPIIGETSQTSRLIGGNFVQPPFGSNLAQRGNTYDSSWMDISIEAFLYGIDYT